MTLYRKETKALYRKHRADNMPASQALLWARYEAKYGEGRIGLGKRRILPSTYDAYEGEEITTLPNGWKIKVEFQYDHDSGPPWKECDGMGVIVESSSHPGESYEDWIINSDRGWYRYFDWKATLPEAIRDGWDAPPYRTGNKHERAMLAMLAMRKTADYLHDWCNNNWWYVGLIVTLLDEDDNELGEDSCWGFESNAMDYITEQVRDWAARLIVTARKDQREARRQERIANRWRDTQNLGVVA